MFNWQIPNNGFLILLLVIWDIFWKGTGLWKAAKKGDKLWFLGILLINSVGILPIFYLWRSKQLDGLIEEIKGFFKKLSTYFRRK